MTKQLKKLSFAKEELVNLNEYEMSHIKGGEDSTLPCAGISIAVIDLIYQTGKDASLWVCPPAQVPCDCNNEKNDQISTAWEGDVCIGGTLDTVVVSAEKP